ncbi:MAG: hypothetical protein AB1Z63_12930 [Candidatus Limnocylindrales bacterium]
MTTEPTAGLTCTTGETSARDQRSGVTTTQLCETSDDSIGQLTLQTFDETTDLRDAWQADADVVADLEVDEVVCENATPGADKWGFGNLVCGVRDGRAEIRWTDTRSGTFGVARSETDDLESLHQWWRENARPLGRPASDSEDVPDEPKATMAPKPSKNENDDAKRKLVRVPGKPRNATCSASIDPIPDEFDRTWNITKVNFRNERGYERVVLQLERTGKNRSRKATRTTVSRVAVKNLRRDYPKAPRPTKGKLAVVLGIDGIDDAPTLFNFRPSSLDYIRQVSIFKSSGGYTAVITTPAAICYEVRVPVWSQAATGNERKAEIYVDLKPR